jgi:2-methylfumaryl-CoA hydratase
MTDWTDPETFAAALDRVETREKGNHFEAFEEGQRIDHDPGLILSRHGAERFLGQTLNHDSAYWRPAAARERGFDEPPIHPDYLLACTMGATVADLSEKGGYFLGREAVRFHADTVPPGTELRVSSTVASTRISSSRPDYGIVTWETEGVDAAAGAPLVSYRRTNMLPRRDSGRDAEEATDGGEADANGADDGDTDPTDIDLPDTLIAPEGGYFEDFRDALSRADNAGDAAVAARHERGRTIDDLTLAGVPLATLNTARQHHNAAAMADAPSGEPVAYGDVTRSVALGHARSDERVWREVAADDERFHDFVTAGDTVFGFTVVRDCAPATADAGEVTFHHVAFTQDRRPVYSGTRTALIERRDR